MVLNAHQIFLYWLSINSENPDQMSPNAEFIKELLFANV